jgi:drug/metabolite transporter (DMT)-like permease
LFVLLWSTGFIGARYGLPYVEPLTFLAVRMVFVVVIMAGIALAGGARWPHANEVGHSLVAGSLVHGLCLGGVFTAISQGVSGHRNLRSSGQLLTQSEYLGATHI